MRNSHMTRRGLLASGATLGAFGLLAACGQVQTSSMDAEDGEAKAAEPAAEAGPKTEAVELSVQDGGRW